MGLKSTNYISKSMGIVLPNAYAILKNLVLENDNEVRAIFSIQANREYAKQYKALDTVEIKFIWDRLSDLSKMAYQAAKTQWVDILDEQTGEITFTRPSLWLGR